MPSPEKQKQIIEEMRAKVEKMNQEKGLNLPLPEPFNDKPVQE